MLASDSRTARLISVVLSSLPSRSSRPRRDLRDAGDSALEQLGRQGGGPQESRQRQHTFGDREQGNAQPAHDDRDAVKHLQRGDE